MGCFFDLMIRMGHHHSWGGQTVEMMDEIISGQSVDGEWLI